MNGQTRTAGDVHKRLPHSGKALGEPPAPVLAQQYGGRHTGSWVSSLPESWIPYVQLARLSPPAGLALIYFPHLFGALLGAIIQDCSIGQLLWACAVLLLWSLLFSNAGHSWNDLVDAPLDATVERTRQRPIPRGAVSVRAAFVFAASQELLGVAVLHFGFAGREGHAAALYALPSALGTLYYPYAKRHTHFAQLVLGFCFAWGVVVGCAAVGHEPFAVEPYLAISSPSRDRTSSSAVRISTPVACLALACVLWTTIYDTIYAYQDLADDKKLGLHSMAVLLDNHGTTKPVLSFLLCAMVALLVTCATSSGFVGWWLYMIVAPGGCALSMGCMIAYVKLKDSASCWWWFSRGFWTAGFSIAGALAAEYLVRHWFL